MYEIVKEFPNEIIFQQEGPCISLYQSTHRNVAEKATDLILFKNLIRDVEVSLKQKYSKNDIDALIKPFQQLKEDKNFWNNTLEGIGILSNAEKTIVYVLTRPLESIAIVADGFYVKPLISAFQSADEYMLLGLSRTDFSLYHANRYGSEEIRIDEGIPRSAKEVLGNQHTESFLTHGSYAGTGGHAIFHGHGAKKDEAEKDLEKYFRYVDKFVLENYSQKYKLPLILITLAEHQGEFRKISNNPYLWKEGVVTSFDPLKLQAQNESAWEIMDSVFTEKSEKLAEQFKNAQANSLATDSLKEAGEAVHAKRIKIILIEAEKMVPGRLDQETGDILRGELENPENADILDDIVISVLKDKGEAFLLPKDKMPTETGIAAIYRF